MCCGLGWFHALHQLGGSSLCKVWGQSQRKLLPSMCTSEVLQLQLLQELASRRRMRVIPDPIAHVPLTFNEEQHAPCDGWVCLMCDTVACLLLSCRV